MSKALAAFFGLLTIQVVFGLIYKLASSSGKYGFSQASSLALAELCKLCMSIGFYYQQQGLPVVSAVIKFHSEVSLKTGMGMVLLSLMYLVVNHMFFYLFTISDPGTIYLFKSSSSLMSAVIFWVFLGRITTRIQWVAIGIQCCGLVVTQFDECKGAGMYSFWVYLAMFIYTLVSSVAACLNDYISKATPASLHAINIWLYASGCLMNVAYYFYQASVNPEEPGFFEGYQGWAIAILILNSLIGIAITAVYKYADAVVKTFAQSSATATLLIVSMVVFGTEIKITAGFACLIIFMATFLYMTSPAQTVKKPKEDKPEEDLLLKPPPTKTQRVQYGVIVFFLIGLLVYFTTTVDFGFHTTLNGEEIEPVESVHTFPVTHQITSAYEDCLISEWEQVVGDITPDIESLMTEACAQYEILHPHETVTVTKRLGAIQIAKSLDRDIWNRFYNRVLESTTVGIVMASFDRPGALRNALKLLFSVTQGAQVTVLYESSSEDLHLAYEKVISEFPVEGIDRKLNGGYFKGMQDFVEKPLTNILIASDDTFFVRPCNLKEYGAILRMVGSGQEQQYRVSFQLRLPYPDDHKPFFYHFMTPQMPHFFATDCSTVRHPPHEVCYDRHIDGPMYLRSQIVKEWPSIFTRPPNHPGEFEAMWMDGRPPGIDISLYPADQILLNGAQGRGTVRDDRKFLESPEYIEKQESVRHEHAKAILEGCYQDPLENLPKFVD
ncbi:nucleotide-sugar transporter-domain-containing protein [Gorgonomyces haynaldii]|nr:nucleotide-sugar transporter-domain-containing protein [Gorgonomyces haynaldii]